MTLRMMLLALLLAIGAQSLAACGRVGPPVAPTTGPNTYPKAYPSANQP